MAGQRVNLLEVSTALLLAEQSTVTQLVSEKQVASSQGKGGEGEGGVPGEAGVSSDMSRKATILNPRSSTILSPYIPRSSLVQVVDIACGQATRS